MGDFFLPFQYPFLVSMQFGGDGKFSHGCGGSIYNERFFVDAAHCVNGVDPASIRIVAGEYLLILDSGLEQKRAVKKITMHPEYNAISGSLRPRGRLHRLYRKRRWTPITTKAHRNDVNRHIPSERSRFNSTNKNE